MTHRPVLAVTMGDPAGIGPEIGGPHGGAAGRIRAGDDPELHLAQFISTGDADRRHVVALAGEFGEQRVSIARADHSEVPGERQLSTQFGPWASDVSVRLGATGVYFWMAEEGAKWNPLLQQSGLSGGGSSRLSDKRSFDGQGNRVLSRCLSSCITAQYDKSRCPEEEPLTDG
jgi:hypothetical protein